MDYLFLLFSFMRTLVTVVTLSHAFQTTVPTLLSVRVNE